MYLRYVEEYPNSSVARDYRQRTGGGHFATALFENRLNDAWIHADFNNEKRMLYLGFRANMPQVFRDCSGSPCMLSDHEFINDIVCMISYFDKSDDSIKLNVAKMSLSKSQIADRVLGCSMED